MSNAEDLALEMEEAIFTIIASSGTAKSMYIEAIQLAKNGDFAGAEKLVSEAKEAFVDAHKQHTSLVQKEAAGEGVTMSILLAHAEDQMMSVEVFQTMCGEFIDLYKKLS